MTRNGKPNLLIPAQMTIADVAAVCRVSPKTIRRLIADGQLPAHRVGRQWRLSPTNVERFLKQRQA